MSTDGMNTEWNDERIRLLLSACADEAMSSLNEEEMDGFDHHFSDRFDKKMKKMLWSERYFGRKIHVGYAIRRAAVILIIAASLATAGTVSAKVFNFRPWEYLPFYSWIAGEDTPSSEDVSDWTGKSKTVPGVRPTPAPTPTPTPVPFSVEVGTEARYALSGDGSTDYFPLNVLGYRNGYTITLESAPDMEKFYIDGNTIAISPDADPGEYTLGYRVTDGNGREIYQDITITVEKAVKVTGRITKEDGGEVRNGYIQFKLSDDDKSYKDHYYFAEVDEVMGTYTVYLPPNRSYEAYISGESREKRFMIETGTDEMKHNFDIDAQGVDEEDAPDEHRSVPEDGDEEERTEEDGSYDPGPRKENSSHSEDPEPQDDPVREDGSRADPLTD